MKLKLLFILSIIIGLNGFVQTSSAQVSAESFKFTQLTNSSTQGVFAKGATIYIGTTSGLLISTDSGTTFTTKTITNGLGSNNVKNVFVDGSTIYAATDGGLSVSTNGGNNFVNYAPASFAYGNNMNDVFADGDTIYALASNRLWISNDAGATFIEKTETDGIGSTIFREIVANGSDVYIATDGGLSISSDGGNTFINKTNTDGLANVGANGVSFSNGVLYAASEGFDPVGGLSISTDKGNTFTVVQQADGLAANSVNTVYSEGVNVFVGVSSSVISISNDSGATFTRYDYDDGILGVVNQIFFDSGKIYVSTNVGVFFGEEAFPEIDIKGNNVSIVNGDTTPSTIDNTDFGVSVNAITKSFTIDNSEGFADLSLTTPYPNYVTISGSTDFTISTQPNANAVTKGSSKTFQVTYTPNLSGNQTAIISIANNDSDENPYTFTISGNKGVFSNYTTTFEPQVYNPNGLTSIGIFSNANFADLDNDGDLDLMSGGRGTSFYYFENTGSDEAPMYAAVQNNPFGLTNIPRSSSGSSDSDSFPTFVDLDGDGDMDIVSGETYGSFYYYENTGTSSAPQYETPIENPFGLTDDISFSSYPTFGDIDNDGDLDLLSGAARSSAGNPIFYYFENTGSSTAPQFSAPISNPFGLTLSSPYIRIQLGDLDSDGDLDLMGGDQYGKFLYFENIGTTQNPGYAESVSNPFGITNLNSASTPTLIDYDLDGDLDIMIGGSGGNFRYFQNGPTPSYTQIPDINFEKRLIALGYDSEGIEDGRALTSDLEVLTQFAGTGLGILDFTGLEAFRDLEVLNIYNNLITSIDLSNNLKLKELYISNETVTEGQVLTSLDISSNVLLEKLVATNNKLTVLDVSNNPLLTVVDVSENELTSLDVSNQPNLLELDFATNQLTSIDVTNNTALTKLQGNDNDLTGAVDVSENIALLNLSINNNENLGNMNVAVNVDLVRLNLSATGSTSVDVSSNTALEEFFVASNNFRSLDVSQNVALKQIGVAFNQITDLDLSANSALILIRAENNSLTSFNIQNGNNANVIQFDVRNNPALECILVDDENAVSNLVNKDATASFSSTVCFSATDYTQIPDINFEKRLIALGYDSEGIEDGRALTSDLEVVTQFAGTGIGILDFTGLEAFRDLEVLNIYNNLITSIDLSNNLKLKELYISNQTVTDGQVLTSLDISSNVLLEKLVATNNQLTVLDVSNNPLLIVVDVSENELTSLDVSNQPNLLELDFATNQLTTIDVTNNTVLTKLQGNDNDLTGAVDVSE
ncbi:FG-GAP-like repeat-containing protein, partial [Polaribacter vadi]|uniref:FG-GAP-like repeat-containing protein n=1 Tax=Polaribacter vadi TaxID=1774273 RepID=UPI0030ED6A1E